MQSLPPPLRSPSWRSQPARHPPTREKHILKTWPELLFQVERWQRVAGRGWTASEIEDVAAYLNHRFYRVTCKPAGCLAEPA